MGKIFCVALSGLLLILGMTAARPAAATIAYVQGAYETAATGTVVTVKYGSAQIAGDLNVVVMAWVSSTVTVQSVTDSTGNTYVAGGSATLDSGVGAQQIYYAKNIKSAAANSNTVTITFNTAISDSDIRIVEYSGIDPVNPFDGGVGASGTGTAQNSGSLTTTNANDLLVAGNFLAGGNTAVGTGFTLRLTTGYSEIVEDKIVTAISNYSATATQNSTGYWLMQMAAFRAASGVPAAPTNLTNSVISSSQIKLTWTASTGATGYVVQRCAGASCTSFAQVGTSTTASYSDTGLSAATSYSYRVDATNAAGTSGFSNTTTGTTSAAGSPPAAPTNLANIVISSNQINLTWTASTGATGYVVQRCAGASCTSFAQIGTATTTSYSDTGLTASTNYSYRVDATNAAGTSGFSNTTTGTTSAAGSPPAAPTNLANSVISSSQIKLTWTASTGATGYVVQRCAGASCTSFAQIGTATTTSYSDTGLTASTNYSYRVDATNAAGTSGFSNTTTGTTTVALPTAPSNLANSVISSSKINLTWTASTSGATGYTVQRCQGASCTSFAQIGTSTTTNYSDTGLSASTSYSYRVDATNTAGASGFSNTTTGTTSAAAQPPTTPGRLSATAGSSTQINLSWGGSTDAVGVTGYLIGQCTGAGCSTFTQIASVAGTSTSYSNTGLASGTSYSYEVRATDAAGLFSGYSKVASAVTPTGSGVSGSVSYGYDALGRLIQVAATTVNSVQAMSYDAAGNISSTASTAISAESIEGFSVSQASAGEQITIDGSGFSTTASSNTVTINGVTATVVSATATQLVVTVPSGASTGVVKVTVGGVAVSSTQSLKITPATAVPTIASFSPAGGPSGTSVTITGTNFSTVIANDKVLINGTAAKVSAATASSVTFTVPNDVSSGLIQVVTSSGLATSTTNFIIPPSGFALTDIVATGTTTENGGALALSDSVAGKPVLAFFNGTEGDNIKVAVQGPSGATIQLLDPRGFVLGTATAPGFLIPALLDASGTYTVVVTSSTVGTVTVYATTALMASANLTWGQETAPTPSIYYYDFNVGVVTTQREFLKFAGALNQLTEVDVFNVSGTWVLSLLNSSGITLWTSSSFSGTTSLMMPALPADDTYYLVFDPGLGGGSFNYNAGIVSSASLTVGSTVTVSGNGSFIVGEGPTARVVFSGTAGETVTLSMGATRAFFYGVNVYYLQGSSQVCIYSCGSGGSGGSLGITYISLPVTGTYIVYLYFASSYPSTVDLRLSPTIPLTVGASATSASFGASTTTGVYTDVIAFTAQNQSVTFHDSCEVYNWALVNSSGTVVNVYNYSGAPPTGPWGLGTLASGAYNLVINTGNVSVGSTAKSYSGASSANWPTTTNSCTLQLTSP